jgi:putative ABC transport system permease protein
VVHTNPVRPPEIVNIGAMRFAPLALAGSMTLALFVGVAPAVAASVRDRRRELAGLRALGFSGPQLRATIGWQVAATTVIGALVGLPVGVAVGHVLWAAFARRLGLATSTAVSPGWLLAVLAALFVLAALAAVPGARTATRVRTAELLRDA